MGYLQFNKTTIQLPIPSFTMTKAEYKAAYGIDLDAIDIKKITLIVDGLEKYVVDEIKIVSDDVLILAGGKILTIGDDGNVSVTTDAYSVENAKPIYYHPISIVLRTGNAPKYNLSFIIIDNNPNAYTLATLKNFIDDLYSALGESVRLNCSGYWENSDKSKYGSVSILAKIGAGTYQIVLGNDSDGSTFVNDTWANIFATPLEFTDGVNKIN